MLKCQKARKREHCTNDREISKGQSPHICKSGSDGRNRLIRHNLDQMDCRRTLYPLSPQFGSPPNKSYIRQTANDKKRTQSELRRSPGLLWTTKPLWKLAIMPILNPGICEQRRVLSLICHVLAFPRSAISARCSRMIDGPMDITDSVTPLASCGWLRVYNLLSAPRRSI